MPHEIAFNLLFVFGPPIAAVAAGWAIFGRNAFR